MRAIDWTKPAYAATNVRQEQKSESAARLRCDLCGVKIAVGQTYSRGPRGEKGVHAVCRDLLIARQPKPV